MYEKIKKWYKQGLWTAEKVMQAVDKGVITEEQAKEILSQEN
jgi:uncharacterized XkdX family phage protein